MPAGKGRARTRRGGRLSRLRVAAIVGLTLAGLTLLGLAAHGFWTAWHSTEPIWRSDTEVELMTTGYCNCEICCSWTTNETGQAVYNYGKMKGRPKIVGQTCTGVMARPGTIAADPKLFKFGTRLYVPGYGPGRVEDIGGAIKGGHLDLWFPTHREARKWGVRRLPVRILND